eukprot:gene19588-biopygen975
MTETSQPRRRLNTPAEEQHHISANALCGAEMRCSIKGV